VKARRQLARLLVGSLAFLMVKSLWVLSCAPASSVEEQDIEERRDHLVARTTSPTYFDDHALTPSGIYASEWQLVTLSMTAAALVNLAHADPSSQPEALEACTTIAERALDRRARSFEVKAWGTDPLDDLEGPKGHIGYLGHLGMVLAAYRLLGGDTRHDAIHRRVSHAIARRMRASASRHLETYPGQIYTADNSVGVAALALYDRISGESHADVIGEWVDYTRTHLLDPDNGIVVFAVSAEGEPVGRGRGSAAGYDSFYLPFIDEAFAREQFERLREHMLEDLPFGAVGVREYADGIEGHGDVDTGPLLLGVSPSATGFAIAGARRHGHEDLAVRLLRIAEIAGFTVPCEGGRCYLLAPLVGDAIVLAMRTATRWDRRFVL
jgi:hypothetical protein